MTDEQRRERKIAIVGFAKGHAQEAPFGDPEWDVWGINRLHTNYPGPYNTYFNLHDLEKFHGEDQEHLEFLKTFGGPVYLRPQDIGKYPIPNAVPFPWEQLVEKYGRYFNNSISWLIAFALEHDPSALGIYGVDMAMDSLLNAEYGQQRPSCEFFIGLALGRGIDILMPSGTDLLKTTHLYGFEDPTPEMEKRMNRLQQLGSQKEELKGQLAQLEAQKTQLVAGINQLDGGMQSEQFWLRNMRPLDVGEPVASPNGKVADEKITDPFAQVATQD